MFVEMFHEWENCLLVLSYSNPWFLKVDDTLCQKSLCQSWCQAFQDVGASSHQVCQPITALRLIQFPQVELISSSAHAGTAVTQKHVPLLLLVYRPVFHAISFRWWDIRLQASGHADKSDLGQSKYAGSMNLGNTLNFFKLLFLSYVNNIVIPTV